jgi:hypothetical protein
MNKSLLISIIALTLAAGVGISTLSTSKVYADDSEGFLRPMLQRLVERFNLNESEVEEFVAEERETRMEERKAQVDEKLNEAVANGTLTEDQKNALIQKIEEHRAEMGELSWEERHEHRDEHREEMHEWAETNGIDLYELGLGRKGRFGKGGFGAGKHGF